MTAGDTRPLHRVLVVDDDGHSCALAAAFLHRAGYEVLTASMPAQAIEVLHANPTIEAVVSDIVMPGMTGFDFSSEVKVFAPHVRFVFMSGYGEDQFRPAIDEPFVPKPFTLRSLADAVAAALS